MKITFLGTGTSQGVPVIACPCNVCVSTDLRDQRLRTSIMVSENGRNLVIDTGPDFRQQMLNAKVTGLDAVVFTHEHKDHVAGLDDIRAFNYVQKRKMDVYATDRVGEALRREFHYVFADVRYPGVPEIDLHAFYDEPFDAAGFHLTPIRVMHHRLPVTAFRIRDFVYITDANYIADEEYEKVRGCKVLVINALRIETHMSHFNLEQALAIINDIQPDRAYLIHISHMFGKHAEVQAKLPANVFIAYDALEIEA